MLFVRFYRLECLVFLTTLCDRYSPAFNGSTTIDSGDPFSSTPIHLQLVTICIAATDGTTAE
ncbi:hypothetical protein [Oscillatoria acuminata]|uniref:Uncharacterized protein n=1 Tax=Oscillatoria acuminata PCC 6304 TaxID=56110 RepID=K9TQR0_9CYAN|nr:hypothetical protein [Oscillatoria acuminata]AFY84738.1 hypothetical protein Oscil6304_5248 [Oscillatoria acuminata PCC 6304]